MISWVKLFLSILFGKSRYHFEMIFIRYHCKIWENIRHIFNYFVVPSDDKWRRHDSESCESNLQIECLRLFVVFFEVDDSRSSYHLQNWTNLLDLYRLYGMTGSEHCIVIVHTENEDERFSSLSLNMITSSLDWSICACCRCGCWVGSTTSDIARCFSIFFCDIIFCPCQQYIIEIGSLRIGDETVHIYRSSFTIEIMWTSV